MNTKEPSNFGFSQNDQSVSEYIETPLTSMKVSVELSMYPLNKDYKPSIISFIKRLRAAEGIQVETNGMSSQVYGDYDRVMAVLSTEIKEVFGGEDKVSMVMKLVNDDLSGSVKF